MPQILHTMAQWHGGFVDPDPDCNSCAMEADGAAKLLLQSTVGKELPPLGPGPCPAHPFGLLPRRRFALTTEPFEQRDQLGVKRGGMLRAAFDLQREGHAHEVNRRLWVEPRLIQTAPLI